METDEQTAAEPTADEPTVTEPTARGRGGSPSLAALLSFLWPGLGQLYLRNRRAAALFAVPAILVLPLLAYELRRGLVVFAARFTDPYFSREVAVIVILLGALRVAAVVHASLRGGLRESHKTIDRVVVAVLVAIIVVSHGGAGFLLAATSDTLAPLYKPNNSLADLTTPAPTGGAINATAAPHITPSINGRVTILFTGADDAATRGELLYDSIMVVSYDAKTNTAQMVSVPRDSASFPLYFGSHQVVPTSLRLNALYEAARGYGSPDSPYMTLVNEVSYLVGIHIDYYAAMNLGGFSQMIDMVGGIDVVNPRAIDDYEYDWLDGSPYGFHLAAGPQHLDGRHALAYVRSRRGAGDNDYTRASRQQEVLLALLHKMAQPDQILNYPSLISTLVLNTTTNFPSDQVADYMAIGQNIPGANITQVVLGVDGNYSTYLSNGASCLYNANVAAESVTLFGTDSLWSGKPPPANTCP